MSPVPHSLINLLACIYLYSIHLLFLQNTTHPNDSNDNTEPANNDDSTYSSQNLPMTQPNSTTTLPASVRAAAKHADETMRVQGLRVEATPFPSSSQYTWTLYHQTGNSSCPHELVVGRGVICSKEELYMAEFWAERRKALKI